jgi:hypothetical protein
MSNKSRILGLTTLVCVELGKVGLIKSTGAYQKYRSSGIKSRGSSLKAPLSKLEHVHMMFKLSLGHSNARWMVVSNLVASLRSLHREQQINTNQNAAIVVKTFCHV